MSEPADPTATPLADVDPDSITALFDADPHADDFASRIPALVAEYRRRADINAAERARLAAEPKAVRKSRRKLAPGQVDAVVAALADKPVSELTLDDLLANGEED